MAIMYSIVHSETDGTGLTIVFSDGTVQQLSDAHEFYKDVVTMLTTTPIDEIDEAKLMNMVIPALTAGKTLTRLSERVSFDGSNILFDGDILDNAVAKHIIRIMNEGGSQDSYKALVNFMEKLYTNPSEKSRDTLYDFIVRHGITIDPDGDFYVYKGVRADGKSINSGFGIVNGVSMNGHLPNSPGSVLEMPRAKVDADTAVGCSTGLHAGSYEYATWFARGMLLLVKVNPRDVVSVPDCTSFSKIRVCRYKVVTQTLVKMENTTASLDEDDDWQSDYDSDFDEVVARVQDGGETVNATFTYERGNGEMIDVHVTVEDVTDGNNGVVLVTRNKDGEIRRYSEGRITDFSIASNSPVSVPSPATAPVVTPLDKLRQKLENGETVLCDFNYTKLDGDKRVLKNFEARNLLVGRSEIVEGLREDGETRHYRLDRMTDVVIREADTAPKATTPATPEEVLNEYVNIDGKLRVLLNFDYTTLNGEKRTLRSFIPREEKAQAIRNGVLVGHRADGELRSYRMERITNLKVENTY